MRPRSSSRLLRTATSVASAAVLALALFSETPALAAGVSPGQATPVQREQAQARFLRGKDFFTNKKYEEALVEFSASIDIVASPNARLYVGRTLRELGRIVPAYVELGRTEVEARELMREDSRYEKAGQSAHEERMKLEPLLAFINVEIGHPEADTKLKVNGDEIRRGGWTEAIPVIPGKSEVVVETPGRPPVQKSLELQATDRKVVTIDLRDSSGAPTVKAATKPNAEPEPEVEPSSTTKNLAWVAGGAAVVGLGMFVFFGLRTSSTYGKLHDACNAQACPPGHESDISTGRLEQTVANVGLAVAIGGALASATLFVLAPSGKSKPAKAEVAAGPSFVGLQGAF